MAIEISGQFQPILPSSIRFPSGSFHNPYYYPCPSQAALENDTLTQNLTIANFLDLSKAFDTISHEQLLQKLNNMGICGLANDWFRSYLSNRKQFMEIHNITLSLESIECGVPHGSILGPILFLIYIYIYDIHNSTSLEMMCFAHTTTCIYSSPSVPELYDRMNIEPKMLNDWFTANRLCLNTSKSKYMIFGQSDHRKTRK